MSQKWWAAVLKIVVLKGPDLYMKKIKVSQGIWDKRWAKGQRKGFHGSKETSCAVWFDMH